MIEGESEKEIRQKQSNHTDEEIEIDLMEDRKSTRLNSSHRT